MQPSRRRPHGQRAATGLDRQRLAQDLHDGMSSHLTSISSALDAAKNGVQSVHIIDGRVKHALLLEILTDAGVGTMIRAN